MKFKTRSQRSRKIDDLIGRVLHKQISKWTNNQKWGGNHPPTFLALMVL